MADGGTRTLLPLRAFELHGQIREKLTALQNVAADLEDAQLSRSVSDAMRANTAGIARAHLLLETEKATALLDADIPVAASSRAEGDGS